MRKVRFDVLLALGGQRVDTRLALAVLLLESPELLLTLQHLPLEVGVVPLVDAGLPAQADLWKVQNFGDSESRVRV